MARKREDSLAPTASQRRSGSGNAESLQQPPGLADHAQAIGRVISAFFFRQLPKQVSLLHGKADLAVVVGDFLYFSTGLIITTRLTIRF